MCNENIILLLVYSYPLMILFCLFVCLFVCFFQIESIAVEILEVSSVNIDTLLTRIFIQFALGIICLPVEITEE